MRRIPTTVMAAPASRLKAMAEWTAWWSFFLVPGAVAVGDHHRGPGGQAGEDPHHQLDDHRRGSPHGGQGVEPTNCPTMTASTVL